MSDRIRRGKPDTGQENNGQRSPIFSEPGRKNYGFQVYHRERKDE